MATPPNGWASATVGDVFEFCYGKALKQSDRNESGNYPVYGSNGVVGSHDKFLVRGPALIIGRKGAAGEVSISKAYFWPIDTTYYVAAPEGISIAFAYYLLRSARMNRVEKSTAIPGLNRNDAYALKVQIPPLNEQHRIVAKIEELFSELEKGVESLKTAREQLKVYRQSVLKAAFEGRLTEGWRKEHADELESAEQLLTRIKAECGARYEQQLAEWQQSGGLINGNKASKPKQPKQLPPLTPDDLADLPDLPDGWRWVNVNQISVSIQYGYTESSTEREVGPRFLRITDIQDNKVEWDEVPFCPIPDDKKAAYLLKSGDLVFARTGATVGKSFLIKGEIPEAIFASYLIRVRFEIGIIGEYVANYFQSLNYWAQITEGQVGIGQPNVNGSKLGQIRIPLIGQSEQHQIVQEIESRFSVVEQMEQTIEESLQKAEALRQSILKRAFEGKLVPQDENDEPASVLLERIRAERAQVTRPKRGRKKA